MSNGASSTAVKLPSMEGMDQAIASSNIAVTVMLRVTMIVAGLELTEEPPSITKWLNCLPAGGASAVIVTELPSMYEPEVLAGSSSK